MRRWSIVSLAPLLIAAVRCIGADPHLAPAADAGGLADVTPPDVTLADAADATDATPPLKPGSLDPRFANGLKTGIAVRSPRRLAVDSRGRIYVVGRQDLCTPSSGPTDVALARFTSSGAIDTSFGVGGRLCVSLAAAGNDDAFSVTVDADDRVVVGGQAVEGVSRAVVLRVLPTGVVDTTFGDAGAVLLTREDAAAPAIVTSVAMEGVFVVVSGSAGSPNWQLANEAFVVKLTDDGRYEPTFNFPLGYAYDALANGYLSARSEQGKIVVAAPAPPRWRIVRLLRSSTGATRLFDQSFGDGGRVDIDVPAGDGGQPFATDVAVTSGERVVAAGVVIDEQNIELVAVARLSASGRVDGVHVLPLRAPALYGSNVYLQTDGKIIVGGTTDDDAAIMRLNADGSPDGTFGFGGIARTGTPGKKTFRRFAHDPLTNTVVVLASDGSVGTILLYRIVL